MRVKPKRIACAASGHPPGDIDIDAPIPGAEHTQRSSVTVPVRRKEFFVG